MKQYGRILVTAGLCAAMLIGPAGCQKVTEESVPVANEPGWQTVQGEDTIDYQNREGEPGELPVYSEPPEATARPFISTPAPLSPDMTPQPSREPIEGDVSTGRFPAYDTGADADWSYQSDELRVAIRRYENTEDQIVYYVADVWIRNINSFRMESGKGGFGKGREDPEDFANRINAVFGVSGTMDSGLVVHNGKKYQNVEDSDIAFRSGIVVIYRDGSVKMIDRSKKEHFRFDNENKKNGGVLHALQFGPILVRNGEIQSGLKKRERHPRILFGCCEPGHYVIVAVDGRTKKSIGMTEKESAELMQAIGCESAINLDGGNSVVMLFMGKTINVPSGKDKDGDGIAGRNIADLLAFAEFDAEGNAPELSEIKADHVLGE
jgi:hypothetical protein